MTDFAAFFTGPNAPSAAKTLGFRFVEADEAEGRIVVEFDAREGFANPAGQVQGGFLAAMLDDTMGPAILVKSGGRLYGTTIDLHVQYLRPVRPGRLSVEARVTQLGRSVAFAEGALRDERGRLCAKATCSAKLLTGIISVPGADGEDD